MWVVGIGASAGGVEALREVLPTLPDGDVCYLIAQHMSMAHPSLLFQVLDRETNLEVVQLGETTPMKAGVVYIPPPDRDVLITGEVIRLKHAEPRISPQPSIDKLFESIAVNSGLKSIGIILSGTGNDGSVGVQAIHTAGGRTIAQEINSCRYSDMPLNALNTTCIDFVLPPHDIGPTISKLMDGIEPSNPPGRFGDDECMAALAVESRRVTGWDLSSYKDGTLHRQLIKRLSAIGKETISEYLDFVRHEPSELAQLRDSMLINVTEFLRDKGSFDSLTQALKHLIAEKPAGDPIRAWIVGCASGEEAYSVAILLNEIVLEKGCEHPIKMFATDISDSAMEAARRGVYPLKSLRDVPQRWIDKYFTISGESAQVDKRLRDMLVIARQDITHDPPLVRMDLVCCRNLLIYLTPEVQDRVINNLHVSLIPQGLLFLGRSESVQSDSNLFTTIDARSRIFQRKVGTTGSLHVRAPLFSAPVSIPPMPRSPIIERDRLKDTVRDRLLGQYSPPSILTDRDGTPLHMIGHVSRYLSMPIGDGDVTVATMVHPYLRAELKAAVARVVRDGSPTAGIVVSFKPEEDTPIERLRLQVSRVPIPESLDIYLLVSFISLGLERIESESSSKDSLKSTAETSKPVLVDVESQTRLEELQGELTATREHLQAVIEELESSNEELQAMNEELQASSEELQATNEELETTNEELQATNEELTTVNETLEMRTAELSSANIVLSNIQESVATAIVLLDSNQQVQRYSPMAVKVFGLLPSDIGTKLSRLPTHLNSSDLEATIDQVLKTGIGEVREVSTSTSTYLMQIQPYSEVEKVTGVVLALADITELAEARTALESQSLQFQALADAVPSVVYQRNVINGNWSYFTPSFEKLFGISPDLKKRGSQLIEPLIVPEDRAKVIDFHASHTSGQIDFKIQRQDGSKRVLRDMFRTVEKDNAEVQVGAFIDITDLANALQTADQREKRCDVMFNLETTPLAILTCDGNIKQANNALTNLLKISKQDLIGTKLSAYIHPDHFKIFTKAFDKVKKGEKQNKPITVKYISTDKHSVFTKQDIYLLEQGEESSQLQPEIFTAIHDQANLKSVTEATIKNAARNDSIYLQSSSSVLIIDENLIISEANDAFADLLKMPKQEVIGHLFTDLVHNDDKTAAQSHLETILSNSGSNQFSTSFSYRLQCSESPIWVNAIANKIESSDSFNNHIILSLHDVTASRLREQSILRSSQRDPLTYCLSRSAAFDRTNYVIKYAAREQRVVNAIVLDIDDFKHINDQYGHIIADDILKVTGWFLQSQLADIEFICRLGSDEFLIIQTTTLKQAAADAYNLTVKVQEFASKIQQYSQQLNATQENERFYREVQNSFESLKSCNNLTYSLSAGISIFNPLEQKINHDAFIHHAELAILQAKAKGRSQIAFYSAIDLEAIKQRNQISQEIQLAIKNNEFLPYLMPIIEESSSRLVGAEMLMRWMHPTRGLQEPGFFIEQLTSSDNIDDALLMCLHKATPTLNQIHSQYPKFRLSINLEAKQIASDAFIKRFLSETKKIKTPLTVEFTEKSAFSIREHGNNINRLRKADIHLSLDDFGTGFSAINALLEFDFDEIKIDQIFVQNIDQSEQSLGLFNTLIKLIHNVGAKAVVEGVSNEKIRQFAKQSEADFLQGYWIAKPMAADAFMDWVQSNHPN